MNRITAKVIQISDLLQWSEKGEIELSPKYQRNNVWNEKAKAYLIDTIIRGLPIPPIFLRQKVDITTRKTFREVIDGQQRVRAILEYIVDEKYAIKKSHNKEFGGKVYSELDDEVKEAMLQYEIVAEVVAEKDDSVIYDMFARLNSNNIVLNKQEIRNSKYWGDYKVFIYRMASQYRTFFSDYGVLSDTDFSRMKDAEFLTSLAIIFTDGVREETPKYLDEIYSKYDKEFPAVDQVEAKMEAVFSVIEKVFEYLNGNIGCFKGRNYLYTLFAAIAHQMFGIDGIEVQRSAIFSVECIQENIGALEEAIIQFIQDFDQALSDKNNAYGLYDEYNKFASYHKIRTTSKNERIERVSFLVKGLEHNDNDDN